MADINKPLILEPSEIKIEVSSEECQTPEYFTDTKNYHAAETMYYFEDFIKHEVEVEEHDLLEHPRTQAALLYNSSEFRLVNRVENQMNPNNTNIEVIIEGSRIKTEIDSVLSKRLFNSKVVLSDCESDLQKSGRYCPDCLTLFPSYKSLTNHTNSYIKDKPYKCNYCDFKCSHRGNLSAHERIHKNEKPYKCNQCDHRFTKKINLTTHVYKLHNKFKVKQFKCDQCFYKCSSNAALKVHLQRHAKEKPFKCDICGYRCVRNCDLKVHIRSHIREKKFHCDLCVYKCQRKRLIEEHIRFKHNKQPVPKPFVCNICHYKCRRATHLKMHITRKH